MRALLSSILLACAFLSGCERSETPGPTTPTAGTEAAPPDPPSPAAGDNRGSDAGALLSRADQAAAEDRLFEPEGDNAFELYLRVLQADDESGTSNKGRRRLLDSMSDGDPQAQARAALGDLFPYGLIYAEQAWRSGSQETAERWIGLLADVRPDSPGLARLREQMAGNPAAVNSIAQPAAAPPRAAAASAASPRPAPPAAPQSITAPSSAQTAATAAVSSTSPMPASPVQAAASDAPEIAQAAASDTDSADRTATPPRATALPDPPAGSSAAASSQVEPPALLAQVAPRYPSRARRQRIEGWVAVRFRIQPDGSVDEVSVTAAEPEGVFDREAIGAVSRWRFADSDREHWMERRIDFLLDAR